MYSRLYGNFGAVSDFIFLTALSYFKVIVRINGITIRLHRSHFLLNFKYQPGFSPEQRARLNTNTVINNLQFTGYENIENVNHVRMRGKREEW
jgi:hypothetical protein